MSRLTNLMAAVAMPLFNDEIDYDAEMENIEENTSPVLRTPPELRTRSAIERDRINREFRELEIELEEARESPVRRTPPELRTRSAIERDREFRELEIELEEARESPVLRTPTELRTRSAIERDRRNEEFRALEMELEGELEGSSSCDDSDYVIIEKPPDGRGSNTRRLMRKHKSRKHKSRKHRPLMRKH